MPLVSLIVPVYNAEDSLEACLESVLKQSHKEIQLILINDGSKDGSLSICQAYSEKDPRVILIDQPNAGPGAARNAGLRAATGDYLQFLDSDDILPAGAVEALVEAMDGQDLVIGHFEINIGDKWSDRGLIKHDHAMERLEFLERLIKWPGSYYYSSMCNKMYARAIIEKAGLRFDESFIWGEDCLFNMRYYRHVQKVRCIPKVVYRYYRKVGGLSWGSVFQLHKGTRIKFKIYRALRSLYQMDGLYRRYYWRVQIYIFNITFID